MVENESLYYNLTQTLHALQKLRDSRKSIPPAIDEHLAKISDAIILCQCACVDEEACFYKTQANWETYAFVLNTLLSSSSGAVHTLLQLYFRKSLYWEHYYRNMMEIIALLNFILYRILKSYSKDDKRKVLEKKDSGDTKFRRKFLTLTKLPAWRPRPSLVH